MTETPRKIEQAEIVDPSEIPSLITLDWLSMRLADISIRAKNKKDLKTEMLALNSLARLHRIQGDGDLSLIPGKLMVEFVHTRLPNDQSALSAEASIPLLSGTLQDPVWREGQWEELGSGPYLDHESGG